MKLRHCRNLISTPDFTRITNLEKLILEGCVNLVKVHPSFGMLKKLVDLNMRGCKRFRRFPHKVEMDSLEVMILSGCSKLDKLPEFYGTTQTLREFCADGTAITELPSFVLSQCNLQVLKFGQREEKRFRWWTSISQLSRLSSKMPNPQSLVMTSLADLCFLRDLNFSDCNILEVPDSIGGLSCLESLDLRGNNFTSLPRCLSQLSHLRRLEVSRCKKLEVLPELPPNLSHLSAFHCTSLHELHGSLHYHISPFLTMYFDGCPKLFRNLSIENHISMSQPLPDLNSSITSHSCTNQFSSFIQFTDSPSNTRGIFGGLERKYSWNVWDIIYHGNTIPEWFTNRSMGNHVKVKLPPDWCISKFRGYGICVVLTPNKSYDSKENHFTPRYHVHNFDGTSLVDPCLYNYYSIGIPNSYIIWFYFTSWVYEEWQEAKNFVTFSFEENDDDVEIKECGVRLVFDEDIKGQETDFSITQDLPTPTQDGGVIQICRNNHRFVWSW